MEDLPGKLVAGVISVLVAVLAYVAKQRLEPKAKVVWWSTRPTIFDLLVSATATSENPSSATTHNALAPVASTTLAPGNPPSYQLATTTTVIFNAGTKKAENIEICHRRRPENFKLFPSLQYKEDYTPDGAHIIKIESLGPKQTVTVEYLAMTVMPQLNYIRAEDTLCNSIEIVLQPKVAKLQIWLLGTLVLIGAVTIIVLAATLLSIVLTHVFVDLTKLLHKN